MSFERGDVVRPSQVTIGRTQFRSTSRLKVAMKISVFPRLCRSCCDPLVPGELFARGSEQTSALCLSCVEPAEAAAA